MLKESRDVRFEIFMLPMDRYVNEKYKTLTEPTNFIESLNYEDGVVN